MRNVCLSVSTVEYFFSFEFSFFFSFVLSIYFDTKESKFHLQTRFERQQVDLQVKIATTSNFELFQFAFYSNILLL
jgi:hypothetical protein